MLSLILERLNLQFHRVPAVYVLYTHYLTKLEGYVDTLADDTTILAVGNSNEENSVQTTSSSDDNRVTIVEWRIVILY